MLWYRRCLPLIMCSVAGLPLVVGCAHEKGPRGETGAGTNSHERSDPLDQLAARQETEADELARALTPPAWADGPAVAAMEESSLAPGSPAVMTLAEVMAELRAARPVAQAPEATNDTEALHLYAQARLMSAEGKLAEAIVALESAAKLDRNSPQIWRALGDAQNASGRKQNAVASYQTAVVLGLDEAPVHWMLGREAMKSRAFEGAAKSFARAMDAPDLRQESDLGVLLQVDLAEALAASGRLNASHELLTAALEAPFGSLAFSRFRPELTEVYRRRPEMWLRAGDMACRLRRPDVAARDYAEAAALPSIDPTQIALRQIWAELARGRSATASKMLLGGIANEQGRIDDRQVAAIVTMSALPSVGRAVSARIRAMAGESALTPSVAARLTHAAAAASSPAEARELLRDLVAMQPTDGGAVVDLLATYAPEDNAGREHELLQLTRRHGVEAPVFVSAALALGRGVDDLAARLAASDSDEAALLRAYMLGALGRPVDGLAAARGIRADLPAKWRAVAELGALCGDRAAGKDACGRISEASPEGARALAAALEACGDVRSAAQVSRRGIDAAGAKATARELVTCAAYARAIGDGAGAEALLARAIEADRFDEGAYEALLNLYGPGGAINDDAKLGATVRALRQNIPSSRVVRTLQAQDSMSRSLWSMAQNQLLSLAEKNYESPTVLEMLVSLWERSAKGEPEMTERGERWLRERLESRPESTLLQGALARVLVARGRPEDAVQILAARTAVWPIPDLCRLRERVLRESLGREKEAERLTEERLTISPPTATTAMEWLELLASRGEYEAAAAKVGAILPEDAPLPAEMLVRLGQTLGRLSAEGVIGKGESACRAVASLFGRVVKGGVALPPGVHVIRLEVIARGLPREPRLLFEAVRDFAKAQPELEVAAVNQGYKWVSDAAGASQGIMFVEQCVNGAQKPSAELVVLLVRETFNRGTLADAERVIGNFGPMDELREVLLQTGSDEMDAAKTDDEVRAELAYVMALQFSARDLGADARALYRTALRYNARHGWSANNLGYDLVEHGEDMVEGERLLEIAVRVLPEESSVLDSLAWLRFRQNRIADETVDGVVREGAMTLITKAIAEGQTPSAEVLDHAGDIHWVSGAKERAVDLWKKSAAAAAFEAGALRQRNIGESQVRRAQAVADRALLKVSAAGKGEMPELGVSGEKK